MTVLIVLLVLEVILHGWIVVRYGAGANMPPLIFGIIYLLVLIAVWLAVPYALWAALIVPIVGSLGLLAAYRTIAHDKTIENIILALNVILIVYSAYLLFFAAHAAPAA